jgi:hypothetical protein
VRGRGRGLLREQEELIDVPSEYDAQLLESVSVRRRRLRLALLHGGERRRRGSGENVQRAIVGLVAAAALCAGCVGWSFVEDRLLDGSASLLAGEAR